MGELDPKVQRVAREVSRLLNEIASHWVGTPRVTLLIRPDGREDADGDFLMTNDKIDEAIAGLLARKHQENRG